MAVKELFIAKTHFGSFLVFLAGISAQKYLVNALNLCKMSVSCSPVHLHASKCTGEQLTLNLFASPCLGGNPEIVDT